MSISGSAETSCSIRPMGKIGVRSGGPAGSRVCGLRGGSGSPGRSGSRFTHWAGISASDSWNLTMSLIWLLRSPRGIRAYALAAPELPEALLERFELAPDPVGKAVAEAGQVL